MDTNKLILKTTESLDKNVINFLINNNLMGSYLREILIEAESSKISVDPDEKREAFKSFLMKNNLNDINDLDDFRKSKDWSKEKMENIILKPLKIRSLAENKFSDKANDHFLKRRNDLDMIVYSIIRMKEKQLALELYLRIDSEEEDFHSLAKKYSEGTEKLTKGIIGPIYTNQANQVLMNKLKSSKSGELIEPFQLDKWWILMRLETFIPVEFTSTIKLQMCAELLDAYLSNEIEKCTIELKKHIAEAI